MSRNKNMKNHESAETRNMNRFKALLNETCIINNPRASTDTLHDCLSFKKHEWTESEIESFIDNVGKGAFLGLSKKTCEVFMTRPASNTGLPLQKDYRIHFGVTCGNGGQKVITEDYDPSVGLMDPILIDFDTALKNLPASVQDHMAKFDAIPLTHAQIHQLLFQRVQSAIQDHCNTMVKKSSTAACHDVLRAILFYENRVDKACPKAASLLLNCALVVMMMGRPSLYPEYRYYDDAFTGIVQEQEGKEQDVVVVFGTLALAIPALLVGVPRPSLLENIGSGAITGAISGFLFFGGPLAATAGAVVGAGAGGLRHHYRNRSNK